MADYKLVDIEQLEAGLTATADAIRAKTGATEEIPWDSETGMAANIEEVFDAGKKAEYDAFWDAYQENGTKKDYSGAFSGPGWSDSSFLPKYDMAPTTAERMFQKTKIKDLCACLIRNGISLDLSNTNQAHNMFADSSYIEKIPVLNITSISDIRYIIYGCKNLKSVEKMIFRNDGSQKMYYIVDKCPALENIIIEGTIGQNGFDIHWSTLLSKDSITSIINALSATTTGLTVTLSLTAVNNAFETSEGAADGSTSEEWTSLAGTKSNWTISLV